MEPSFQYSAATRHLLKDGLMISPDEVLNRPDYCVFLTHYIDRIRRWKASNSSKLVHCSRSRSVSDGLMATLGQLVVDSVLSILPSVEMSTGDDDALHFESESPTSDYGDSAPHETPVWGNNLSPGRSAEGAAVARLRWELLLVSKATLSVIIWSWDEMSRNAVQTAVEASGALDSKVVKALIDRVRVPSHVCMVKAAQYVSILLLELSYRCQGIKATDIADNFIGKFVVGLLSAPYSAKTPGRKIATIAIARFVQYGTLLCPEVTLRNHEDGRRC